MKTKVEKIWSLLFILIVSCNSNDDPANNMDTDDSPELNAISLVNAFPNLRFNRPVDLQSPDDGTDRIFVIEQRGIVRVFPNDANSSEANIFLDLDNQVSNSANEQGLLGMAFHPNYRANGYFYVCYNPSQNLSVISRFQVSTINANMADPMSELILLEIPQPFTNHNGGQLAFGPDGFLYIASGDGGSGGDPQGNAQNRTNLLGAVLRIDVDRTENGLNYAVPSSNPFVNDTGARPEIFAYGLRNPWRMSFDTQTGLLWSGDVGQDRLEEINIIANGNNYGWNILEGTQCFQNSSCDPSGLTLPVFEYNQDQGDVSITGGYVYRGTGIPSLQNSYVYGDFESGRIWALTTTADPTNTLLIDSDLNIASFGTDMGQELYICSFDGAIYRFQESQ